MNLLLPCRSRIKYPLVLFVFLIFYSIVSFAQNGKSDGPKDTKLKIHPNPAKDTTQFKLTFKKKDVVTLEVYHKGVLIQSFMKKQTIRKEEVLIRFDRPKGKSVKHQVKYDVIVNSEVTGILKDIVIFDPIDDVVTEASSREGNKEFLVSPNPTGSFVEINSPGSPLTGLSIHDMIGNNVLNERVEYLETYKVDLSHLHPGVYFLTLKRSGDTDIVRVVKTE